MRIISKRAMGWQNVAKFLGILFVFLMMGSVKPDFANAERVKVGTILPLTGKLAPFGEIERNSFVMAVHEINAAGGVQGDTLDLIIEDTAGHPDVGRTAMDKLISQDKVLCVVGGISSTVAWTIAAVAQDRRVPFLINTASADKITEQGWDYVFRLSTPTSEQPKTLASFLTRVAGLKTVAILYEDGPFGDFELKKFVRLCRRLSLKVVMREGYPTGSTDFRPTLEKARGKNPDMMYVISRETEAAQITLQAKELNLVPRIFLGHASGFTSPEFQRIAGIASEYVCSHTLWAPCVPYPGAREYFDNFLTRQGASPDYHGPQAFAAMNVIADALKRALSLTPEEVRNSLAQTDMMTVFGSVKFISYGKKKGQNTAPTYLVQWINGQLETVWPKAVSTALYVYPQPE
jgi:branched-chain amino acid transport system substrate-binding protein